MPDFGFRGTYHGAVQTKVTDQPNVGVPGSLAYASDYAEVFAYEVGEEGGILCGAAVKLVQKTESSTNLQRPNQAIFLPEGDETEADFGGIALFEQTAQTTTAGLPGFEAGRYMRVLRPKRAGGNVYVKVKEAVEAGDKVFWCIAEDTFGGVTLEPGDLINDITGRVAGSFVELTKAEFATSAAAGGLAIVELG